MSINKKGYWFNFLQLVFAVFLIFFCAVTLGEPAAEIVLKMNDRSIYKTYFEQVVFWVSAIIITGIWCMIWIWFKKSEKVCVDYWHSKSRK